MSKKKKRILLLAALAVLLAGILIFLGAAVTIVAYSGRDDAVSSDVIIVLGAGAPNGEVSPVFRERLNHAVLLFEEGYAPAIILTGGVSDGNTMSEAAIAKEYVISKGVPEEVIHMEESSTITEENLRNAKEIMEAEGFAAAIITSDPLHMRRAMTMAKDFGIDAVSSPTGTSMYRSLRTKVPFLMRETFFYVGYCVLRPFR